MTVWVLMSTWDSLTFLKTLVLRTFLQILVKVSTSLKLFMRKSVRVWEMIAEATTGRIETLTHTWQEDTQEN